MDTLDNLLNETASNVSAAAEHANNLSSHSSQLRLQLSKTQELHSRETSTLLKETAENLLHLIPNNVKENVDERVSGPSFLEFKSDAEKRLASIDGILTAVGCIIRTNE